MTACDDRGVTVGDERIEADAIIWAAGVMASRAGKWLNAETDRSGRVMVGRISPFRAIVTYSSSAIPPASRAPDGKPLPGIAPVAKAQGAYVAARIVAELDSKEFRRFRYRDLGSLATIGRKSAVVQMGRLRLPALIAWLLWSVAHIYFLIGFRNRLSVVLNWGWNYFTFQRGTRLITGLSGSHMENMAPPVVASPKPERAKDFMRGAA